MGDQVVCNEPMISPPVPYGAPGEFPQTKVFRWQEYKFIDGEWKWVDLPRPGIVGVSLPKPNEQSTGAWDVTLRVGDLPAEFVLHIPGEEMVDVPFRVTAFDKDTVTVIFDVSSPSGGSTTLYICPMLPR